MPVLEGIVPRAVARPDALSARVAKEILAGFDAYLEEFRAITMRARRRFELRDWQGRHLDSLERLDIYDVFIGRVAAGLEERLAERRRDETLWAAVKEEHAALLEGRFDAELAETFFNSVSRKIFLTVGVNRSVEYFHWYPRRVSELASLSAIQRYPVNGPTRATVSAILEEFRFAMPYEDLDRDAKLVADEIDLRLFPLLGDEKQFVIEFVRAPFYRNKAAYLVGRIVAPGAVAPLILPLYNSDNGVYVDTVLLTEEDASRVFSFAFSYFHVAIPRYDQVIVFLRSILPDKPLSELYISLGFNRHGKTEFYRQLHAFVHKSRERFLIAPGREGAVMAVFTLPEYNFVFKVIKDRPCFLRSVATTDKTTTRAEVMDRYAFVCRRDRAGRLVDTQEFENLRFRTERFSMTLLEEFGRAATNDIEVGADYVVIGHCYVQRRVVPLPLYFEQEKDAEALRRVVVDFGYFLKDLAGSGLFPGDLFNTWNYGVTRRGRVVLYDYDDIMPIERITFQEKPRSYDESQDLAPEEDWIIATPNDFFVEEMRSYSGIPERLKGVFERVHADLFTTPFWRRVKEYVASGGLIDITPYDRRKKFFPR